MGPLILPLPHLGILPRNVLDSLLFQHELHTCLVNDVYRRYGRKENRGENVRDMTGIGIGGDWLDERNMFEGKFKISVLT